MKKIIIALIGIGLMIFTVRSFAQVGCTTNAGGDVTCPCPSNPKSLCTTPSQTTLDAEAMVAANQQAQANLPANKFSTDTFVEDLAQTPIMSDTAIFPLYAVLKDLTFYKNFQGLANELAALLQAGALNQTEVSIIDNTLEEQQINMASYNSQINLSY